MATMSSKNPTAQSMLPYPSTASNLVRITYDNPGVQYEQPYFTYEYITYRGNAELRTRRGVVMESNNGSL